MKKMLSIMILLLGFVVILAHTAFAANLAGVWKGSVKRVNPTACIASLPVTLTLNQCSATSRLVRGTATVGTKSLPVVGKISTDGVTVEISGSEDSPSYVSLSLYGKYTDGAPDKISVSGFFYVDSGSFDPNILYDAFTLTKQ